MNPTTIVKAYNELRHEGVVEMQHGKGVFVAESAGRMTETEMRRALRRLARQLAVEAVQMGATPELVRELVEEEMKGMSHE